MNELLEKTEVLCLKVDGMDDLEDIEVTSLRSIPYSSFRNLRVLTVSWCLELRYLFTLRVATSLSKLEYLDISSCPAMKEIIHIESSGSEMITFPKLKVISLENLTCLSSFCNTINVIELPELTELQLFDLPNFTSIYPENKLAASSTSNNISDRQPLLKEQVLIPKLEKLHIYNMDNLEDIWPCEEVNVVCILREITVNNCVKLVNLFPTNPMSLLHHLEQLNVENCRSIQVLFNIDLGCVGSINDEVSSLRSIQVRNLENLREVWSVEGAEKDYGFLIRGFQFVESLEIENCERFRNVFTPTTANFDMSALTKVIVAECGESWRNNELDESSQEQDQLINVISDEEIAEVDGTISNVAFPSHVMQTFDHVHTLYISYCNGVDVMFEIESPNSGESATTHNIEQPLLFPCLKDLKLEHMKYMSYVWKCNWHKFLFPQQQRRESSFQNLTTIFLSDCDNMTYLLSPLMAKLFSNLREVCIEHCAVIEEVVSNRDDHEEMVASASTNTINAFFPHLDILRLICLPWLKRIGGGGAKGGSKEISFHNTTTTTPIHDQFTFSQVDVVSWSLCQYPRKINITSCNALSSVIPYHAVAQMQKLEMLSISCCKSLVEVFETQGINNSGCSDTTLAIPRLKSINLPQLSNLTKLDINNCDLLQHAFTFSILETVMQLEELKISRCKAMKVIVKEENGEETRASYKVVVFPRLKSIELIKLPKLTGFFLGMDEFRLPSLDNVRIETCPQMMVFTSGRLIAPNLICLRTGLGKHSLECGLNFHLDATLHQTPFSSLDDTLSFPTTPEGMHWSFHNLIEIDVESSHYVKNIVPCNKLLQLQKLEMLCVQSCIFLEEVFEAPQDTHSGFNELESVVQFPKLRELTLISLENFKYIWKNNFPMVMEYPNLTKVFVHDCPSLEHVFTSSMVGSLLQLRELHITRCTNIRVIVNEENGIVKEAHTILLPRLKSLKLKSLSRLEGFSLGNEGFLWPLLDKLEIMQCPSITVFTKGKSVTPELKIDTSFGRCEIKEDLNSFIKSRQEEGLVV